MNRWKRAGSALPRFVDAYAQADPKGYVRQNAFYSELAEFAATSGTALPTKAAVTLALPRLVPGVRIERKRLGGGKGSPQVSCWVGIRLKGHLHDAGAADSAEGEQGERGLHLSRDTRDAYGKEGVQNDSEPLAHPTHSTQDPSPAPSAEAGDRNHDIEVQKAYGQVVHRLGQSKEPDFVCDVFRRDASAYGNFDGTDVGAAMSKQFGEGRLTRDPELDRWRLK